MSADLSALSAAFSRRRMLALSFAATGALALPRLHAQSGAHGVLDVRDCGARGDGTTLDTAAIQSAIDRLAASGGGTVRFSAGNYLCYSVQLRSHITLEFCTGATLVGGTPSAAHAYDAAEPQPAAIVSFQDYGHNHWHNSMLWGEGIEDVALTGPGLLWGRGLQKGDGPLEEAPGAGNKILSLKNCRNVLVRDLRMLDGGHFAILATGVDNLTLANLLIDTRRDGIDIDCCRNVHVSDCTVNAPWDDGIVIKSSYSLGALRTCEQITITGCTLTGNYLPGTLLDATYRTFADEFPDDRPAHVSRIKIGTETNGDIRNIAVSNCVFEGCRGFTITCEDGAHIEDVVVSNATMRNMFGPPVFIRLGDRLRGPAGTTVGVIRRILFDGIDCWNAEAPVCSVLAGLPGHPLEEITIRNLRVQHSAGGTLRHGEVPENSKGYPDVEIFGPTPAQGFYVRHVSGLKLEEIELAAAAPDPRPLVVLDDVQRATLRSVELTTPTASDALPAVIGRELAGVALFASDGHPQPIAPYEP